MNKAEEMKKVALYMKDLFKKKGSFSDRRFYRSCLRTIKNEAVKGKLEYLFKIDRDNYYNLNLKTIVAWLERDGFKVELAPYFLSDIDKDFEFINDWEMKVSWNE